MPLTSAAAGAAGGWGARLKRAASSLTRSNNGAPEPVVTMRNSAPTDLPDEFISSLLDDVPLGRADLIHPTTAHEAKLNPNSSNLSLASVSTLHASHFSYPYLSGMHRHTSPQRGGEEEGRGGCQATWCRPTSCRITRTLVPRVSSSMRLRRRWRWMAGQGWVIRRCSPGRRRRLRRFPRRGPSRPV